MANLKEAATNLKEQQKQVEAQLHQIMGAISVLDGLIEQDKEEAKAKNCVKKDSKKSTDVKQSAPA